MLRDHFITIALWIGAFFAAVGLMGVSGLVTDSAHQILWELCATVGLALMGVCFVTALVVAVGDEHERDDLAKRKKMIPLVGIVVSGIALIGFAGWYFWPSESPHLAGEVTDHPSLAPETQFETNSCAGIPRKSYSETEKNEIKDGLRKLKYTLDGLSKKLGTDKRDIDDSFRKLRSPGVMEWLYIQEPPMITNVIISLEMFRQFLRDTNKNPKQFVDFLDDPQFSDESSWILGKNDFQTDTIVLENIISEMIGALQLARKDFVARQGSDTEVQNALYYKLGKPWATLSNVDTRVANLQTWLSEVRGRADKMDNCL